MELGLLHDFFGNFSTRGERYYFGWRGARKVRMCTRDGHKVTLSGGGGMQGKNMYTR